MALTATGTDFYTILPSAQNSISFSLSFEGNVPHHLTNSEVVSKTYTLHAIDIHQVFF